jgi:cytoskeletal protein RodZ
MSVKPKSLLLLLSGLVFVLLALLVIFSDLSDVNPFKNFERISGQKVTTTESETKVIDNQTDSEKVFLNITAPLDKSVVKSASLLVKGQTVANAEVFVNDKETKADKNGNFSLYVTLDEGENTLTVIMNDSLGNYIEKEITVTLESF